MNFSLRPPGGDRTWNAILLLLLGAALLVVGFRGPSKVVFVSGGIFLVSGMGVWGRFRWAHWTGGIGLLLWVAIVIFGMFKRTGFRWTTGISMLFLVWVAWQLLSDRGKKPEEKSEKDDPDASPPKPL